MKISTFNHAPSCLKVKKTNTLKIHSPFPLEYRVLKLEKKNAKLEWSIAGCCLRASTVRVDDVLFLS